MTQEQGLVAVLDALGAASYSDSEIAKFLASRDRVLKLLRQRANAAEVRGQIQEGAVSVFTFNDTVLLLYRTTGSVRLHEAEHFGRLVRKFVADSLVEGILFRGSLSVGAFYADEDSNSVMGPAVTDAAAWYEASDWIGVMATPHAAMSITALAEKSAKAVEHVFIEYAVPLTRQGGSIKTLAINWPKALFHERLTPFPAGAKARPELLSMLTRHRFAKGTESKYVNSVSFFDYCESAWKQAKTKASSGANKHLQPPARKPGVKRRG
ncbi:MAG: hypothetical protein U0Q55_06365 [Vicinamibacterales bacterium]